jgi:hypothetical protein
MIRTIFLALLFLAPFTAACRPKKTVHIRSFKVVMAVVNRAKSFQLTWSNGDETASTMVSCPDKMASTTNNDVGVRSAVVRTGTDSWQSLQGISGPWVKQSNPPPQILCGMSGLVFPAELDVKTATRGKLRTSTQGSCEEWRVKTRQKDSALTYVYCVGLDKFPMYSTTEGGMLFKSTTFFFHWNTPVKIEPPKNGEPPCCPPMR